jgi:hypothetical protein
MTRFDPKTVTLSSYRPPVFTVSCPRCNRSAEVDRQAMLRRFGDVSLHEVAQRIASAGGCQLAVDADPICSSTAFEIDPTWWGSLDEAFRGGWTGRLTCARHTVALRRTEPCPGFLDLDVKTLIAILGGDFKLEKLRTRCSCWQCNTRHTRIEWLIPDEPTPPGGTEQQTAQVLRLRPGRLQLAKDRFRAVEGGKR